MSICDKYPGGCTKSVNLCGSRYSNGYEYCKDCEDGKKASKKYKSPPSKKTAPRKIKEAEIVLCVKCGGEFIPTWKNSLLCIECRTVKKTPETSLAGEPLTETLKVIDEDKDELNEEPTSEYPNVLKDRPFNIKFIKNPPEVNSPADKAVLAQLLHVVKLIDTEINRVIEAGIVDTANLVDARKRIGAVLEIALNV